jgi:hypothetical protein
MGIFINYSQDFKVTFHYLALPTCLRCYSWQDMHPSWTNPRQRQRTHIVQASSGTPWLC